MEASTKLIDFPNNMKVENNNHFAVDDLLNFPQEDDEAIITDAFFQSFAGNSGGSSPFTAVQSCNSSISGGDNAQFNDEQFPASELCVPYDDLAELEWLSNLVEDTSFSTDDLHNLQFIPTGKPPSTTIITTGPDGSSSSITTISDHSNQNSPPPLFPSNVPVPGKARSKRPRAAPYDWSSRLLLVSGSNGSNCNSLNTLIDQNDRKSVKKTSFRKRENGETPGRKCLHCASEKTPQWRTGPMGPKTLCNACGVRYKSGRLVPEYRPASSPTFISAKHSNSHRKVIELRRQKEMQRQQAQASAHQLLSPNAIFGVSNAPDDYLIYHHQHINAPDYTHII